MVSIMAAFSSVKFGALLATLLFVALFQTVVSPANAQMDETEWANLCAKRLISVEPKCPECVPLADQVDRLTHDLLTAFHEISGSKAKPMICMPSDRQTASRQMLNLILKIGDLGRQREELDAEWDRYSGYDKIYREEYERGLEEYKLGEASSADIIINPTEQQKLPSKIPEELESKYLDLEMLDEYRRNNAWRPVEPGDLRGGYEIDEFVLRQLENVANAFIPAPSNTMSELERDLNEALNKVTLSDLTYIEKHGFLAASIDKLRGILQQQLDDLRARLMSVPEAERLEKLVAKLNASLADFYECKKTIANLKRNILLHHKWI